MLFYRQVSNEFFLVETCNLEGIACDPALPVELLVVASNVHRLR